MALQANERVTLYRDPRYYCGSGPGVACLPDGAWVVTFRRVSSWLTEGHAGHWHPATESSVRLHIQSVRT